MKKYTRILQPHNILCGLGAVAILSTVGCAYPVRTHAGYADRAPTTHTVTQQDYVYYPTHNVHYNRGADHFRVHEGNRWVTVSAPRNVSRQRVLSSEPVSIEQYGTPERHYTEYVQPNLRSGNQSLGRVTTSSTEEARTIVSRTTPSRTVRY